MYRIIKDAPDIYIIQEIIFKNIFKYLILNKLIKIIYIYDIIFKKMLTF